MNSNHATNQNMICHGFYGVKQNQSWIIYQRNWKKKWLISVKVRYVKQKRWRLNRGTTPPWPLHDNKACWSRCRSSASRRQSKSEVCSSHLPKRGKRLGIGSPSPRLEQGSVAPLQYASYISLPKKLSNKKAMINIKNSDSKGFMWSVPTMSHCIMSPHVALRKHAKRLHQYQQISRRS